MLSPKFQVSDQELNEYVDRLKKAPPSALKKPGRGESKQKGKHVLEFCPMGEELKERGAPAVVVSRIPRQECVPQVEMLRYSPGSTPTIRVYVRFASGNHLSLDVDPDLKLGPPPEKIRDKVASVMGTSKSGGGAMGVMSAFKNMLLTKKEKEFSSILGDAGGADGKKSAVTFANILSDSPGSEEKEHSAKRGFQALLAKAADKRRQTALAAEAWSARKGGSVAGKGRDWTWTAPNFKSELFRLTGVPCSEQRLVFRGSPMSIDASTLREYGVTHGETMLLIRRQLKPGAESNKPAHYIEPSRDEIRAGVSRGTVRRTTIADFGGMLSKRGSDARSLTGQSLNVATKGRVMPRWRRDDPHGLLADDRPPCLDNEGIVVYNYEVMKDCGHSEVCGGPCGAIRRLHGIR